MFYSALESQTAEDLVEFVEYPRSQHPFLVATQAHPEYKSRPTRPHPLFAAFVEAALSYGNELALPVEPWRENSGQAKPATAEAEGAAADAAEE